MSHTLFNQANRPFLLRKLHSLSGVVPLGVFLCLHLWTNAQALQGQEAFHRAVEVTHRVPFLLLAELLFVILPLLFHAGYGIKLGLEGRHNVGAYPHSKNWAYTMQRVSGLGALLFIAYHVWQFRWQGWVGKMAPSDLYGELCASLSSTQAAVPWMALGYLLGLAACVFHFTNGLYGFCFSWGITVSRSATRVASLVFGLLGIALFLLGATTVIYYATGSRLFFVTEETSWLSTAQTCQDELALREQPDRERPEPEVETSTAIEPQPQVETPRTPTPTPLTIPELALSADLGALPAASLSPP